MPHQPSNHAAIPLRAWAMRWVCLFAFFPFNPLLADPIDQIVGKISTTGYGAYIQDLQNFGTRYYNTQGNLDALAYIHDAFLGHGLTVSYDSFSYGGTYNNVVATLPGKTHPENVYIVGAHMDSYSTAPLTNAPGADDNASGMAAVLEMAKAMVGHAFESTIKFFGFNAEEQGLVGSRAYADKAKANGERVLGMLNFDMIAYPGTGGANNVFLAGNQALVDKMAGNALKYSSLTTTLDYRNLYGSDHYYFHSDFFSGSSSAFAIEAAPASIRSHNPNYHQITDTTAYLNIAYGADITRMGVATLAGLAGPIPEPSSLVCLLLGLGLLKMGFQRGGRTS